MYQRRRTHTTVSVRTALVRDMLSIAGHAHRHADASLVAAGQANGPGGVMVLNQLLLPTAAPAGRFGARAALKSHSDCTSDDATETR